MASGEPGGPGGSDPVLLTREAILQAVDLEEAVVEVPEWGGAVRVRAFSDEQRSKVQAAATTRRFDARTNQWVEQTDTEKLNVLLFIHGVVEPQFTAADYPALRKKSARALARVIAKLNELTGLTEEAVVQAEAEFPAEPAEAVSLPALSGPAPPNGRAHDARHGVR